MCPTSLADGVREDEEDFMQSAVNLESKYVLPLHLSGHKFSGLGQH